MALKFQLTPFAQASAVDAITKLSSCPIDAGNIAAALKAAGININAIWVKVDHITGQVIISDNTGTEVATKSATINTIVQGMPQYMGVLA